MSDYLNLAARLDNLARERLIDGRSIIGGKDETNPMLHEAADAIRTQAFLIEQMRTVATDEEPLRCPTMLPNTYGKERCGRERGHEGKCCYARGD